jgi:hypothetical protein
MIDGLLFPANPRRHFRQECFSIALRWVAFLETDILLNQPANVLRAVHPFGGCGLVHRFFELERASEGKTDASLNLASMMLGFAGPVWFSGHIFHNIQSYRKKAK